MELTLSQFAKACGADESVASTYFADAVAAMDRFAIESRAQVSAFCATMGVETQNLTKMEESLYYKDPARIADLYKRVFDQNHDGKISPEEIERAKPYVRNSAAVSKMLYNGYHGRGGCMLTWEGNYKLHSAKLGYDYVGEPALLLTPFHAMLIAGSFWDEAKCNDVADNMDTVTLRVNGVRRLHLAERIALRDIGFAALA